VEQEAKALADRQRQAKHGFSEQQKEARAAFRRGYLQESRSIRTARAASKPKGLAAFLAAAVSIDYHAAPVGKLLPEGNYLVEPSAHQSAA
jgi:hypothetical protein